MSIAEGAISQVGLEQPSADAIERRKRELEDFILETCGMPVDTRAVAATLESRGLRPIDAQADFGEENLFELAEELYVRLHQRVKGQQAGPREVKRLNPLRRIGRFILMYAKGSLFAMPMTAQIIVLFLLSSSLWAYLFFSERQATVIAIGTIASYIVTGGFTQIISRRGMFYWKQDSYLLAKRICYRFFTVGLILVVVVAVLWYIFNLIVPFFEQDMIIVCLMYFVLLSCLWLNASILYTLESWLAILIATVLGGLLVWVVMNFTPWGIYIAHLFGMLAANILAFLWGYQVLARKSKDVAGAQKLAQLPRDSITAYLVSPYFVYGIFYFGFLFLDRLIGWSASYGGWKSPYIIWFRTPYEVGIDLALISLILTIAMLEYTINEFATTIIPTQEKLDAMLDVPEHNRTFKAFYFRQLILLLIVAVVSIFFTHMVVNWLRTLPDVSVGDDRITPFVFNWGMVGYALLAWGLLNAVFFLSLSRPGLILRALGLACLVNIIVGFFLSRVISYEYSIIGLVVGAFVFGAVSTWYLIRVLNSLDYYYYSAY